MACCYGVLLWRLVIGIRTRPSCTLSNVVIMKIFVLGAHGQLGHDCLNVLGTAHDVAGLDLPELDITQPPSIAAALDKLRPDLVLNCAAYTQVDACESDRDKAWHVNAIGPRLLAETATQRGLRLVHISTDYVFDGARTPPGSYHEKDRTNPISHYGASKWAGERAVLEVCPEAIVLRTAWLYGIHGRNFLETILRLCVRRPPTTVRIVDDQFGCPTWSYRLANQIARLVDSPAAGLYHAAGEGHCSRFEFAKYFLDAMEVDGRIQRCNTSDFPTPATRPANSILTNTRLIREGLSVMTHWTQDINEFVARHRDELLRRARENQP